MSTIPNSESKPPSVDYILSSISDEKTLALFDSIANSDSDNSRSATLRKSNLTEKQYYARISGLMDAGLIKRRKGEYSLTLMGKVVYDSRMIIGKVLTYYGKLKAIEEIEMSYGPTFPKEELAKLINALIDSDQIKDAIMKPISVGSNREDVRMQLVKKKPNRR
jgi:predicted transcriptional regulator